MLFLQIPPCLLLGDRVITKAFVQGSVEVFLLGQQVNFIPTNSLQDLYKMINNGLDVRGYKLIKKVLIIVIFPIGVKYLLFQCLIVLVMTGRYLL